MVLFTTFPYGFEQDLRMSLDLHWLVEQNNDSDRRVFSTVAPRSENQGLVISDGELKNEQD